MTKTYCATDDASTKSYEELKANLARLEAEVQGEDLAAADRAERRLAIETCHQVKENGRLCGSAAVSGRHYCYFHLRHRARRLVMARAPATACAGRPGVGAGGADAGARRRHRRLHRPAPSRAAAVRLAAGDHH